MKHTPVHFDNVWQAQFVDRPGRFIVRCRTDRGGLVRAFLPNPGRMRELLLRDVRLYLTEEPRSSTRASTRRTRHTVIGVERDDRMIFLHTHKTNTLARYLIDNGMIADLAGAEIVASEVVVGRSRFDFLVRLRGRELYLEVKSCTLYGNGVAMFPDAVTSRGRKHLIELAALSKPGARHVVLFVVHTPCVRWFMPDYHTDLAFSETLLEVREQLQILPVAVSWNSDFTIAPEVRTLDIPWSHLHREVQDRGGYLLILHLRGRQRLTVGALGDILLLAGYYVYVGSAMRSLGPRIERHLRRRKKFHWHIDYLRQVADSVVALPVRCSTRRECDMAVSLGSILDAGPPGFGSSDCRCPTHLFHSEADPLNSREFHAVLQHFRMVNPTLDLSGNAHRYSW